jgi:hypothetical protein
LSSTGQPEGFEWGDEAGLLAFGVDAAGEVVAAEFVVDGVGVGADVPGDDEDRVADGHGGSFLASPPGDLPELGGEVGVAGSASGPAALGEDPRQRRVALGGPAGLVLARRSLVAQNVRTS